MNPMLKRILILAAPFIVKKLLRGKKVFRYLGLVLLLLIGGFWLVSNQFFSSQNNPSVNFPEVSQPSVKLPKSTSEDDAELSDIKSLYESRRSGTMVYTVGHVTRILADDNEGSRHQRFILDTAQGVSVLVAHNIDLAPRVPIQQSDQISIRGQYEWSEKGGVIHWTHHDPRKKHPEGWILHNDVKYE